MFINKALGVFAIVVLLSVLFLIFAGAAVTSNEAGLAVPDWPTTYGENMFTYPVSKWHGGIFYEHGHRLIASAVGALTVILAIWIFIVEKRRWVKVFAILAVLAVILQGLLGGLTVLWRLPLLVSTGHAVLGQIFMCLIAVITFSQLRECRIYEVNPDPKFKILFYSSVLLTLSIFIQLILGALMRHSASGLAVPDFPTSGGYWIPTFDEKMLNYVNNNLKVFGKSSVNMLQIYIHMAHRIFAFVVILIALVNYLLVKFNRASSKDMIYHAYYLIAFLCFQVFLGVLVIYSLKFHLITSMHVLVGALMLAVSLLLVLRVLSVGSPKMLTVEGRNA